MDYNQYKMTMSEVVKYAFIGSLGFFMLALLFYGDLRIAAFLAGIGILYIPIKKQGLIKARKRKLKEQFKESLYALSSSISVGKSVELAFIESLNDLKIVFYDHNAFIITEFEIIARKISMNESIESALLDFALRADDEDIMNFTNVFITAKRTGGNLVDIMKYTITSINEKLEIIENINVMITGKKYEQQILALLLPFIILYLNVFSSGFVSALYETLSGRIAMTLALGLYILSFVISKKVVDIEV